MAALQDWFGVVRQLGLGGLKPTLAAQSWHGWRYSYLDSIAEVHADADRLAAERRATYGGRCEVYRYGLAEGGVSEVDASGHYPALAAANPLPARIAKTALQVSHSPDSLARQGYLLIAQGRVHAPLPCLPCVRVRLDGGRVCYGDDAPPDGRGVLCREVVYPVGTWRGTYCWPEIQLLYREGGRAELERWWCYEPCATLARYLLRLRAFRTNAETAGNRFGAKCAKHLAVAIIGKMGALGRLWCERPAEWYPAPWAQWWEPDPETGELTRWRSLAGRVQMEKIEGSGAEAIPAVAAWVYSLGRVRLYEWLKLVGREHVYYTDTDSLWTSAAGVRILKEAGQLRPNELGGLRVKTEHAWARFYGVKHYETPNGVKWAGVPQRAMLSDPDGWCHWAPDSPGQAAYRWRPPVTDLSAVPVPELRTSRGANLAADGTTQPLEVAQW